MELLTTTTSYNTAEYTDYFNKLTDLKSNFPFTMSFPMTGIGGGRACSGAEDFLPLSVCSMDAGTAWDIGLLRGLGAYII